MNILHVVPYYAPAWANGGVVRAVTDQTRGLAAAGHTVLVLTTDTLGDSARAPAGKEILDGVTVIRVSNLSGFARRSLHLSTPAGFTACLRRLIAEQAVDLVHCHEIRTMENLFTVRAIGDSNLPMIVSPHGTAPYDIGRRSSKQLWDSVFGGYLLSRIDQVIALTEAEAQDVRALWQARGIPLRPDRVAVVPNGIFAPEAVSLISRESFRTRWGLGADPTVVYLGRLAERKGLPLLISAFAEASADIPDARLLIAGPDENMRSALERRVKELNLARRVVFTGMLAGDEKFAALAAADIFALPAVGEGLSMAMLEAMASGLPVVLTEDCHFPEAARAGAGLVVSRQAGALGDALRKLLLDPEQRAAMGKRAAALIRARYLWPQVIPQLEAVYRKLARDRGNRDSGTDHGPRS